jgi:hypothetical protein
VGNVKFIVFVFPLLLSLSFFWVKLAFPDIYIRLIQEDSIFEYTQSLFYFALAVPALLLSATFFRQRMLLHCVLYIVLAAALLFVALEEVSWGQRIFGIENPAFFSQHNVQGEITVHNLKAVQLVLHRFYIFVGAYGVLAWIAWSVLMPKSRMQWDHIANFIAPGWYVSSYFLPVTLIYVLFDYIAQPHAGGFLAWRDQEPAEFLLSLGFFIFVVDRYLNVRENLTN